MGHSLHRQGPRVENGPFRGFRGRVAVDGASGHLTKLRGPRWHHSWADHGGAWLWGPVGEPMWQAHGAGGLEAGRFWGPTGRASAPWPHPGRPGSRTELHLPTKNRQRPGLRPTPQPLRLRPGPLRPDPTCRLVPADRPHPRDASFPGEGLSVLASFRLPSRCAAPGVSVSACCVLSLRPFLCGRLSPSLRPPPPAVVPPRAPFPCLRARRRRPPRLCGCVPRGILPSRPRPRGAARVRGSAAPCPCIPRVPPPAAPAPLPRRYRIAVLQGRSALRPRRQ